MADLIKATYTQKSDDGSYIPYAFKTTADWTFLTDNNGTDFSEHTVEWKFTTVDTYLSGIKTEIGFGSEENAKINGSTKVAKHVFVNETEQVFSNGVVTIPNIATTEKVSTIGEKVLEVSGKLSDIETGINKAKETAENAIPKSQIYAKSGENNTEKMVAYATKNGNSWEIPVTLLPDTIVGQLCYKGTIAGKSGSGTFYTDKENPSGTGVSVSGLKKGNYYICSQAIGGDDLKTILGTATMVGLSYSNGLNVGDWFICLSDGNQFAKIDNTDSVSTIDGNTGKINLRKIKDTNSATESSSLVGTGTVILPKVAVGEKSGLSVSDSLGKGEGLAYKGRKFVIGTGTDDSGVSYTIPSSSSITAWNNKPSVDTKLNSFSGSVKSNSGTGYDDGYTLSVADTSGKSVSTDIPALSGTQSVGLVSTSMPQKYGKGKSFQGNVMVTYPGNVLNHFHIEYNSYQGEESTPYLLKGTTSGQPRFKIPSRDDAVTTVNSQKTGSFITETQTYGLCPEKRPDQTYTKDYLSAMITLNGVSYRFGRKIVLASGFNDSILDELIPNGFAIIAETKTKWTVTFQPGNGHDGFSYTVEDGSIINAPDTPVSDGHEFDFWANSETPDTPYDFTQPITGDVTIVGVWKTESESWDKTYDTAKWMPLSEIIDKDGTYKFYPYKKKNVEGQEGYSVVALRKPYSESDDGGDMYAKNQMYLFPGMRNLKVATDSTGANSVVDKQGFMSGTYTIEGNPLVEYTRILGTNNGAEQESEAYAGLTVTVKGGKATVTVSSYMPFRLYPAVVSGAQFGGNLVKKIGLADNEEMLSYYSMFTDDLGLSSSSSTVNYPVVLSPAEFFGAHTLLSAFSGIYGLMYERYVSKNGDLELRRATTNSVANKVPNSSWETIETYEFTPEKTTFEQITTGKAFTVSDTSVFKDWYVIGTKVMYTNS